ncbi:hypothetical protein L1049_019319 [Liquidambar formosana]|uniref:Signal peptidase complex subunit 2 n=1 Tax=Liquidambar formosana TaxID=63359 RepID=A0AAP0S804_LIQFO
MASNASKNTKKANLLDHHSIKHILDESVSEIVTSRGYVEDVRMSNVRLLMGTMIIIIALVAQFYPKKFPENRNFLIGCIILYPFRDLIAFDSPEMIYTLFGLERGVVHSFENMSLLIVLPFLYIVFNGLLQLIIYTKEKNAILFTYPPAGSFNSTGLVVSSKLPRFSDLYTLTIASADPKSISANKPVELTKSVTQCLGE